MPTIAVIGPGAVGGAIAAWLAQNPENDVTVAARTPFRRLVVDVDGHVLRATPRLITEPAESAPVDWVLVATKAYAVRGTAMWFPGFTEAHTRIAILQNGVEHVERFDPYAPTERLLPVMVDLPAERGAPGRVRQTGPAHLAIARSPDGADFAELFAGTGIEVTQEDDMRSVLWRKLCLNAAGAISAVTLSPPRIARHPAIARFMHEVVEECVTVGRAEGANLEDEIADRVVAGAQSSPRHAVNSLHADRLAGRPMEIDARNGAIVRIGRRHGIPTPQNALLVSLLEAVTVVGQPPLGTVEG
ncbi:2-dehydropantoate 2-reductase [Microbacterium sp. P5_E9]